jgi:hypothetical protein
MIMKHKQFSLEFYCWKYGIDEGTRRYKKRGALISQSKISPHWEKFIRYPGVIDILGNEDLTDDTKTQLQEFFTEHNWKRHRKLAPLLAHWIKLKVANLAERYDQLCQIGIYTLNKQACILRYGEEQGLLVWYELAVKKKKCLKNSRLYYADKGLSEDEITETISQIQTLRNQKAQVAQKNDTTWKSRHTGFVDYWIAQGHSETKAAEIVSIIQTRDLNYFVTKYGEKEGTKRFEQIKAKRRNTWTKKDKVDHARKTTPQKYNPQGEEIKAIKAFLLANNIDIKCCKFGSPKDQFWQNIPNVGFRRYDLAVFHDTDHKSLKLIMEYHGPGHINFSDYRDEMENEVIMISDRKLYRLGTYGASYKNDLAKKTHIIDTFPGVQYCVMWRHDWKAKKVLINELRCK